MRCNEARRKLTESLWAGSEQAGDQELLDHLRECPACARQAHAARILQRDIEAARVHDEVDTLPLSVLRTRVETRARLANRNIQKENTFMATLVNQFRKRPRFSIGMVMVMVALAFAALVPFSFERTIGYEVAIAGVDKELATDTDKVSELLMALGLEDAAIDISNCEATCQIKVSDLKSEGDVEIVIAAFNELGDCELEEVTTVLSDESLTLLGRAKHRIFISVGEGHDDEEIHRIVVQQIEQLKSDSSSPLGIWCCAQSGEGGVVDVDVDVRLFEGSQGHALSLEHMDKMMKEHMTDGEHTTVLVNRSSDGATEFHVTTADGEEHYINMDDDDAAERLQALGVSADLSASGDGMMRKAFARCVQTADQTGDDLGLDPSSEKAATDIPDGYQLSQNYPNPFNPTTQIHYSLSQTQRVTLEIINMNGQVVSTLVDGVMGSGDHTVEWDATSSDGKSVATGVYFYRLTAGDFVQTRKMTYLK